jgi:hypothetical protein
MNDVLKRTANPALHAALNRLIRRAEQQAREGKPRLLELLAEALKPRVHHVLHYLRPNLSAPQ